MARRIGFAVLYGGYLAAFVLAVDYFFFWRPFYDRLHAMRGYGQLEAPRYVDRTTMRRLGSLRSDRRSSFTNYSLEKPSGVIRVCAFGDSFTYGDEAADGHDFPAYLQEVFREHALNNVEVLSFGNSWYGFHQAYILWDAVGRDFGCDFVLLGPDCFQPERDTTFNHSNLIFPYYMHARYVIEDAGLRRLDVLGDTPEERFAEYFAFRPRRPYARYDRRAPAFLAAVMPEGRTLANPFYYYDGSAEEEAYITYTRLLAQLAAERIQIVLFHSLPPIVDVAERVAKENLIAVVAHRLERFPYHAPGGHYSSFGNRWVAEQYFSFLVEGARPPTLLEFEDPAPATTRIASESAEAGAPAISSYDRVYAEFDGQRSGFLATASPVPSERGGKPEDLAGGDVVGLLALVPEGRSRTDAAFVPTSAPIREGDRLSLRNKDDGAGGIALSTVHLLDARANVGVAVVPRLEFFGQLLLSGADGAPPGWSAGNGTSIVMGETPVLHAVLDERGRLDLRPVAGRTRGLRVGEGEYASLAGRSEGALTLVLEKDGAALRVPFARWRKVTSEVFPAARRLPAQIVSRGGQGAIREAGAAP